MPFQDNRANQVICTGISQIILGCCVFTLCFILSERKDDLGYIFQIGVAYWGASPMIITGVLGIIGGFTGKFTVTGLFLAASVISCVLGGILAACVGFALTAWRSVGECEHVHCPYDTESILMIALVSLLILQAAISLSGVIESSQLLCCVVPGEDHVSIVSLGNSSQVKTNSKLRSERLHHKLHTKNDGFFSTNYETPFETFGNSKARIQGLGKGENSFRISEIGTIV